MFFSMICLQMFFSLTMVTLLTLLEEMATITKMLTPAKFLFVKMSIIRYSLCVQNFIQLDIQMPRDNSWQILPPV